MPLGRVTRIVLGLLLGAVILMRVAGVVDGLQHGDETALLSFPLAVGLPSLLVIVLGRMPPAVSREGALMRLGAMVQCVAIVALPRVALHLALGLPVVFLAVEVFETRCPRALRETLEDWVLAR